MNLPVDKCTLHILKFIYYNQAPFNRAPESLVSAALLPSSSISQSNSCVANLMSSSSCWIFRSSPVMTTLFSDTAVVYSSSATVTQRFNICASVEDIKKTQLQLLSVPVTVIVSVARVLSYPHPCMTTLVRVVCRSDRLTFDQAFQAFRSSDILCHAED